MQCFVLGPISMMWLRLSATRILRKFFDGNSKWNELGPCAQPSQRLMPYWNGATSKASTIRPLCLRQHCTIVVFGVRLCVCVPAWQLINVFVYCVCEWVSVWECVFVCLYRFVLYCSRLCAGLQLLTERNIYFKSMHNTELQTLSFLFLSWW